MTALVRCGNPYCDYPEGVLSMGTRARRHSRAMASKKVTIGSPRPAFSASCVEIMFLRSLSFWWVMLRIHSHTCRRKALRKKRDLGFVSPRLCN